MTGATRTHRRCLRAIAFSLLLVAGEASCADRLGRLFLTPEQRTALELRRRLGVPAPSRETGPLRLDGVIRRNEGVGNGRVTIWINGRPQRDDAIGLAAGFRVPAGGRQPDRIALSAGHGSPVSLRVGETLRPATPETGAADR